MVCLLMSTSVPDQHRLAEREKSSTTTIDNGQLAELIADTVAAPGIKDDISQKKRTLFVDCRTFAAFNASHVRGAVNAFYSKLMRRRLCDDKLCSDAICSQLLGQTAALPPQKSSQSTSDDMASRVDVVLYADPPATPRSDNNNHIKQQRWAAASPLAETNFRGAGGKRRSDPGDDETQPKTTTAGCGDEDGATAHKVLRVLHDKLEQSARFGRVMLLRGGFSSFERDFPELCEKATATQSSSTGPTPLTAMTLSVQGSLLSTSSGCGGAGSIASLSQPCLVGPREAGPTQILSFLYLGSQQDALDAETRKKYNITAVLNLSITCPMAEGLVEGGEDPTFLRIPVNDSYAEKLLPHFDAGIEFLERSLAKKRVVLVHCLAGISRSATMAIAFLMKHLTLGSEAAYAFVKERRPSISPNFNFMGQLLEWERTLVDRRVIYPLASQPRAHSPPQTAVSPAPPKVAKPETPAVLIVDENEPSCSTTSSQRPNAFGKREMVQQQEQQQQQQQQEQQYLPVPSSAIRPNALGLARKSAAVTTIIGEQLPSPSTELSKLSFSPSTPVVPATENAFYNPCFSSPITTERSIPFADAPSSAASDCSSISNPFFQIPGPPRELRLEPVLALGSSAAPDFRRPVSLALGGGQLPRGRSFSTREQSTLKMADIEEESPRSPSSFSHSSTPPPPDHPPRGQSKMQPVTRKSESDSTSTAPPPPPSAPVKKTPSRIATVRREVLAKRLELFSQLFKRPKWSGGAKASTSSSPTATGIPKSTTMATMSGPATATSSAEPRPTSLFVASRMPKSRTCQVPEDVVLQKTGNLQANLAGGSGSVCRSSDDTPDSCCSESAAASSSGPIRATGDSSSTGVQTLLIGPPSTGSKSGTDQADRDSLGSNASSVEIAVQ